MSRIPKARQPVGPHPTRSTRGYGRTTTDEFGRVLEQGGPTSGPSLKMQRLYASKRLGEQGVVSDDYKTRKEWQLRVEEEVKAERERLGPRVYDQAVGRMVPNQKALAKENAMTQEKWDLQEASRVKEEDKRFQEEAVQRAQLAAKEKSLDNPASTRQMRDLPEVREAIETGDIAAIEAATVRARDRLTQANAPETETRLDIDRRPRGYTPRSVAVETTRSFPDGAESDQVTDSTSEALESWPEARTVNVREELQEPYQRGLEDDYSDELQRARSRSLAASDLKRNRLEAQNKELAVRLTERGIDPAQFTEDGEGDILTLDTSKANGALSQSTFQSWEDDKLLASRAKAMKKSDVQEKRYLEQAAAGKHGSKAREEAQTPEGRQRRRTLETNIQQGKLDEQSTGRSQNGFYRRQAEQDAEADYQLDLAQSNLINAANIQTQGINTVAKTAMEAFERFYHDFKAGDTNEGSLEEIKALMAAFGAVEASAAAPNRE